MADSQRLSVVISALMTLSVTAVLLSVLYDFKRYGKQENVRREKHSTVATGTMLLFFVVYYLAVRLDLGRFSMEFGALRYTLLAMGLLMVLGGCAVNIWGRLELKGNWANHIKIYDQHYLVQTGPFALVRHPLYSSLFLMAYGGSLVYLNWLSAILTTFIFLPMMNYRAAQEEVLLRQAFPDYGDYCRKAGRFLPKLFS